MSIFEFIGLIIAFFSFFYMVSSRKGQPEERDTRVRPQIYEDDEEDEEDPLVKLLATFEKRFVQEEKQSPKLSPHIQKRKTEQPPHMRTVEGKHPSPIPEFEDKSHKKKHQLKSSRAKKMIYSMPNLQDLVVYQEIMGKPIGLRSEEWP